MLNEIVEYIVDSSRILLIIIFGGIAIGAVLVVTDQIVQNSGYVPLQNTYQMTKPVVTTASDVQDWWGFVKSLSILIALCGGGYV